MCKQGPEELRIPNVREPGVCMEENLLQWRLKDIKAWVSQDCRFVFLSEVIKLVWVIPGSLVRAWAPHPPTASAPKGTLFA